MRTPSTEHAAILASTARVRVVRAVPGSGKAWLVAEVIREELRQWRTPTSGVAALSFTRVGGEEISRATRTAARSGGRRGIIGARKTRHFPCSRPAPDFLALFGHDS